MLKPGIIFGVFLICVLRIHQGLTFPAVDEDKNVEHAHHNRRVLTPEEVELANSARAQIAKVLERNLIRLFAAITLEEKRASRQFGQGGGGGEDEAEDEDPAETATFNPNTLPQVAALLGAIFSGNLNLTNVVDRAFYLVPDTVRTQVTGLFKLLGGNAQAEPAAGSTNPPPPPPVYVPHPLDIMTTESSSNSTGEKLQEAGFEVDEVTSTTAREPDAAVFGSVFETKSGSGVKKPTIGSDAEQQSVLPVAERIVSDDNSVYTEEELRRAEADVIESAKLYEPFVKDKQPRWFLGTVGNLFRSDSDYNLTNIIKMMPDLFKGARQAFFLLESLGEIGDDLD